MMGTLNRSELQRPVVLQRITLGGMLFLLILSIAATLRFGLLAALPLNTDEARQALEAWQYWQPAERSTISTGVSPAYFTFTTILFAFLGASDTVARLAPAMFGFLVVALPWLWRSRLGTAGALATSALLAVSPTMGMVSTKAGGEAMAIAATLLLFISWSRFREEGAQHWLVVAAGALGFGLATAPLFYSALLTLAVAWFVQRALDLPDSESPSGDGAGVSQQRARLLLACTGLIFLLIATFFLWRPAGIGHAATQIARWLAQFDLTGGIQALALPILALGRYELIVVTLGAAAIVWASWRGYGLPLFLVYWFAAALLLLLLQQGTLTNVLLLVLPSYLLLGLWLNHALSRPAGDVRWALVLAVLILGAIAYFNGARYLRVMTSAPQQLGFLFLTFVALASAFVAINFVRSWDRGAAYQGALVGILLLFVIYSWGTTRWMLAEGGNDPREYWVQSAGDDDLRTLARILEEISWQSTGTARELDVLVAVNFPTLRWYLRDFPNTIVGDTVPPGSTQHAIITRTGEDVLAPGDNYLGSDLGLAHTGVSTTVDAPVTLTDTLRWWLFHEHSATILGERIILWARSDVLQ